MLVFNLNVTKIREITAVFKISIQYSIENDNLYDKEMP